MPRTTLNLDASVIRELRQRSERESVPMGQLASRLLARALKDAEDVQKPSTFRWISRDLGLPRVDLEDKDALYDILDRER